MKDLNKYNQKFKKQLMKKVAHGIKHHNYEFKMVFEPENDAHIKFIDKSVNEINDELEASGYLIKAKYENKRSVTTHFVYKLVVTFTIDIVSEEDIKFNKMINRAEDDIKW